MKVDKQDDKYVLMTYRSQIVKILPSTYYDSDSGWGCMLRVGQMAIANLIYLHEHVPIETVLHLFWDNSEYPFSIQSFTLATTLLFPNMKPFEWYNPCQMGFIVKYLLQGQFPYISTTIFLNNCIFLSEIPRDKPKILVMIMARIGLEQPEEIYLPATESLMSSKYFFAAMGGTPKHAHLFLKTNNKKIGYLDPHKVGKAAASQEQLLDKKSQYFSELSWIKISKIDSSMCLIFRIEQQQVELFWKDLEQIKEKHKEHFFLYMEREKPSSDDDGGIVEIDDL